MPTYEISQLPVNVSDTRARELVASLGLTLLAPVEVATGAVTITVLEDLSPAQVSAAQDAIRAAVLASIGTITKRT